MPGAALLSCINAEGAIADVIAKITNMKSSSICFSLAAIICCWSLSHCSKHDAPVKPSHDGSSIFPPAPLCKRLGAPLQTLIDRLQAAPDHGAGFTAAVKQLGTPYWSKCLFGQRQGTIVCLLPVKQDRDSLFSAFIAIEADTGLCYQLYTNITTPGMRSMVGGGPSDAEVNHALNALNNLAFGSTVYAMRGVSAQQLKSLPAYQVQRLPDSVQSLRYDVHAMPITSCYSWSACMGDGAGNCVGTVYHFTECVTAVIWVSSPTYGYGSHGGVNLEAPPSGGGGGHGTPAPAPASNMEDVEVNYPKQPITDPAHHLECFDRSMPARLTVYVDQPLPGTTDPVSIFGGIGHTFICLEQGSGDQVIRRSIGFYPETPVNPIRKRSSQSILGNDGGREYNVKWQTGISADQLVQMLDAIVQYFETYDIEQYNCANFVVDIAEAGGIYLPRTKGWWYVGRGLNPGALGEDLRRLPGSDGHRGKGPEDTGDCQ